MRARRLKPTLHTADFYRMTLYEGVGLLLRAGLPPAHWAWSEATGGPGCPGTVHGTACKRHLQLCRWARKQTCFSHLDLWPWDPGTGASPQKWTSCMTLPRLAAKATEKEMGLPSLDGFASYPLNANTGPGRHYPHALTPPTELHCAFFYYK